MNTLKDCLSIYLKLMKKDYYITLENGVKIKVYFEKKNFYHLLGLHAYRYSYIKEFSYYGFQKYM